MFRRTRGFALVIAVALLLTACGGGGSAGQTSEGGGGQKGGTLSLLVWEGYADDSFVKPFEKQSGCQVQATYAGSSDEMVAKFQSGGGGIYDLVSASGDATMRLIEAGAVQPIDTSKVSTFNDIVPFLQKPAHTYVDGKLYGVSFMWGPNPLIYNADKITTPPTSWNVLFDPQFKGRVTIPDNPITIADVALWLGFPDPYDLTDDQLQQVKQKLLELKPQIRKFWTSAGEFTNLFLNNEVDLGHGWPLMTAELKKAGYHVGETVPQEGTTGWADSWMISKNSKNIDCAYKWINYVTSPEVQVKVVDVTQYSPVNLKTADILGKERADALHIDDLNYFKQIHFWKTPKNYDKWIQIWNEIKQ